MQLTCKYFILALVAGVATAQDPGPAQYKVTVTEGAAYLTLITDSATKTPTPLLDVPQSIT